ncbi:hypothetical protein CC80DRAFT_130810 [Byssothecium circinans]|uniref:Uncharacterized protein n=1 Tax=Byssothecium circinans TaxID=147558 RepID=A0A6A5TNH8_9PLEO|nr:hypothetical protein CC80DRAFT_130810 [Byssothecium circinans]
MGSRHNPIWSACITDYPDLCKEVLDFFLSTTGFCMILLALATETVIHSNPPPKPPNPNKPNEHGLSDYFFTRDPSPRTRANRFVAATICFGTMCACATMAHAATHDVRDECAHYVNDRAGGIVYFLLIMGFSAWLRALVDCVLVRWGKSLTYPSDRERNFAWPVCAPLWLFFFVLGLPLAMVLVVLWLTAGWIMGRPDIEPWDDFWGREDGKIGGQVQGNVKEAGGLRAEQVEGKERLMGEEEESPAYEEKGGPVLAS